MKYYLKATILEGIERAKKLKSKFPNGLDIHFQKLAESSLNKIDDVIAGLNLLKFWLDAEGYFGWESETVTRLF